MDEGKIFEEFPDWLHGLSDNGVEEGTNFFSCGGKGSTFVVELGVIVETVECEVVVKGFTETEVEVRGRVVVRDIVPGEGFDRPRGGEVEIYEGFLKRV